MSAAREKFSAQVSQDVLNGVRELAKREGRQFQAVVEEAFLDVLEKHSKPKHRAHVFGGAPGEYGSLCRGVPEAR